MGLADLPLYRAKAGGGNTFCFFNAHIEKATLSRHRLEENCPWRYHGKAPTKTFSQLILTLARRRAEKCRPLRPRLLTALPLQTQARFGDYMTTAMLDALRTTATSSRPATTSGASRTAHNLPPQLANRQDRLASLYGTSGRRSRLRHSRASAGSLLEAGRVGSDLTASRLESRS
jgi:hypothetical protein